MPTTAIEHAWARMTACKRGEQRHGEAPKRASSGAEFDDRVLCYKLGAERIVRGPVCVLEE